MNSKKTKIGNFFLVSLFTVLLGTVMGGCSDDKDELQGNQYGYVQFKLYKTASYEQEGTSESSVSTRAAVTLDKLGEAQKVEIEMQYEGKSITQTLVLNAYNEANAEFGMRSDKLKLLVGDYKIVGYRLLDKLDNVITGVSADSDAAFTVVSRGLTVKDLLVDAQARGTVTFKLAKTGIETRAAGEYLFSKIRIIDVTVMNTFTRVTTELKNLKVTYKEDYVENQNPDDANDKYMDIGTAKCDSAVWLPAGTYQVTSYTTYSKSGALKTELETASIKGAEFTIEDNKLTENADVPIKLSATADYIKDYKALKILWEKLGGKNWKYSGSTIDNSITSANWNFNKELDMWGDQPGVTINDKGRVTGISIEGFGAQGRVPDAIGQLEELQVLNLGSHGETAGIRLFDINGTSPNMTAAQKQKVRMSYKEMFLDYDPREGMSELLQDGINRSKDLAPIKKSNRITLKDTQIGNLTNKITFISKAIQRLTKLQQFYIGNSPITADNICADWEDASSEYAQAYSSETLNWSNLKELTDIEVYNCSKLTTLPKFLYQLPEMQLLNIACNAGITGEQLKNDWAELANSPAGAKVQILYMGYNKLESFPTDSSIKKMKKLGLLDCSYNKISQLSAFGSDVKLSSLILGHNEITEIPEEFCGFTDQVESLDFSYNKLKYIPNIFDAKSVFVMGSVTFSHNEIGSDDGKNVVDATAFKGINVSTVTLSYNQIKKFPTELFSTGSPLTTIDLSNNLMTEIPEYSLKSKSGAYKNTHLLQVIDLRFNKLTALSDDFRATTLPYLTNMDVSYNCFSKFPTQPLNSSVLQAFGIRYQRDAAGNRILREWPEGITKCPSLIQLQIGSNDIRKVEETITPNLWILDIKDNPNISIDMSAVCAYIQAGAYYLFYDKTQDIRGCDALGIER